MRVLTLAALFLGLFLKGVVFAAGFTNPISPREASDPFVTWDEASGYYYLIATGSTEVRVFRARRVGDLLERGESKVVYRANEKDRVYTSLWSPEMHRAPDGKWYIYTSARMDPPKPGQSGFAGRKHLVVLGSRTTDPFDGFEFKGSPAPDLFAIDPTVTTMPDGRQYICFSECYTEDPGQFLVIRDLTNPWTFGERRAAIARAELPWELVPPHDRGSGRILEGPFFLRHGDRLFVVYSANGCFIDDYCLGVLEFIGGKDGDLCRAENWRKWDCPLMTKGDGVFGPGHATFFTSPDERETWIAHHGMASSNPPQKPARRMTYLRKLGFDEEGRPVPCLPIGPGHEIAEPSDGPTAAEFENPVIDADWADPTVWDGGDGWYYSVATYLRTVRRSRNLIDWEDTGRDPLTPEARKALTNLTSCVWAPCVTRVGGRLMLYISLFVCESDNRIQALSADSSCGPFEFCGNVIDSRREGILNTIDPFVIEADGKVWMFFGSCQDGVHRVELTADGLGIKPGAKPSHVAGLRNPGKDKPVNIWGRPGTWEGAYVLNRNDWWYLFVSGGIYRDHTYYLTVGRSRTIDGTFLDREGRPMTLGQAEPILMSDKGDRFYGPGHNGDVFKTADGQDWIFYHAHDARRKDQSDRPTFLQKLQWSADGWPVLEGRKPKRIERRSREVEP